MQPTSMFCEEQEQAAVAKGVDFFLNKLKRAKVHRTKRDKHLKNLGLTQFKGKVSENEQNIFARMLKQQKLQKRKLRNAASSDLNDIGNGEVIWADELPVTSVDSALEIYTNHDEVKGGEVSHMASQSE